MAPLLISYGQAIVDEYHKEQMVKQYLAEQATSSTPAPAIDMSDESTLHIENNESHESSDVSLDQSNHGFSLVNVHWASFSTGLSSVLVIMLAGLLIAGCCYLRGRRQRQSRARHSELLHALSSSARHVSTATSSQSGKYPGINTSPSSASQDIGHPVVRYSASSSSASCGLPGCSTSYERVSLPAIDRAVPSRFLPVSHEALPAVTFVERLPAFTAVDDHKPSAPFPERRVDYTSRQTGINSLIN